MLGGLGDDTYYVDNIGDVVIESANAGRDTVRTTVNYTAADNVEVVFASGTDNINLTGNKTTGTQLSGNAGTNVLTGGSGADRLYSRGGADTLQGGDGNDVYFVDSADARIVETGTGGFNDSAYVYVDNYVIPNYVDQVTLASSAAVSCYGNGLKNIIHGNSQNNYLFGAGGLDFLLGGDGHDTLRGGVMTDFLYGDAGDDVYVMGKGDSKDYINNNDAAGHDTLLLEGVSESQIWLQKSGNDLLVSIIGSSDGASFTSWYLNASSQVDDIKVGTSGKVLSASKVDALVQAMSSLTPPAAGQTTLPQAYQDKLNSVIAASWA